MCSHVLDTDLDNLSKIKSSQRGSFVTPAMPRIAHLRCVSCTRRQQDLFKAPVGLQCGKTSILLP